MFINIKKIISKNKKISIPSIILAVLLVIWLGGSYYLLKQSPSIVFENTESFRTDANFEYELDFVRNKNDEQVSLWYIDNPRANEVVLYLHGNAGRSLQLFPDMTEKYDVLSPAYPGYHESEGSPSTDNVYEAAGLAYNELLKKGYKENQITIYGHSMGGSPAVYLASKKDNAQRLIIVNTFHSMKSMCWDEYSIFCTFAGGILNSAKYANKVEIPVRQFAYKKDKKVPYKEGEKLFKEFKKSTDKKFFDLDAETHSYFSVKETLEE